MAGDDEKPFHGLPCPRAVVGAWQLSAGHSTRADKQERAASVEALLAHIKCGMYAFDCADIYTGVEETLGDVVAQAQADSFVRIHTKCVPDLDAMEGGEGVAPEYLELVLVRSLNRLRLAKLDLVQFHWWLYSQPGLVDSYARVCALRDAGLITHVGLVRMHITAQRITAPHCATPYLTAPHRTSPHRIHRTHLDQCTHTLR